MRPNSKQLAMRDPALAALMGVLPGSDFGAELDYRVDSGEIDTRSSFDLATSSPFGADFGEDDELSVGYDGSFGADAPAVTIPAPQSQAQLMAVWQKHHTAKAHTDRRVALLEPNKYSTVKVERYAFSINQALVLGTALAGISMSGNPDVNLRPARVAMNAPSPGFVNVTEIKVANVSVTSGGSQDAFDYNANAVDSSLSMPTLSPQNKATVLCNYTGLVPPGFAGAAAYTFTVSFRGWATIIA